MNIKNIFIHPFYTHRPYLRQALKEKPLNILEFGVGIGSSAVLYKYAKKNPNVKIVAYENDPVWLQKMAEKYSLPNYTFHAVKDWNELLKADNFKEKYDLVFIDQAPWAARIQSLDTIKGQASKVILHDFDYFGDIWDKYKDIFKVEGHTERKPPTLVLTKK